MQRSEPAPSAGIVGPRRAAPRWIVAACGMLLALLLAEAIARIEGPPVCVGRDGVLLSPDDEVGWTFTPGLTVTVDPCAPPGTRRAWTAPVAINEQGLHDQPWPYAKPAGEVRVLLLGNEVADGVGIARADRLSVRLAHLTDRTRGARRGDQRPDPGLRPRRVAALPREAWRQVRARRGGAAGRSRA